MKRAIPAITLIAALTAAIFSILNFARLNPASKISAQSTATEISDIENSAAKDDIQKVVNSGIMNLTGPKSFSPDSNITVKDFNHITDRLAKQLKTDPPPKAPFGADTLTIKQAAEILIHFGTPNLSSDRQEDYITRAELAKVISSFL
jgi:hypothetical protein